MGIAASSLHPFIMDGCPQRDGCGQRVPGEPPSDFNYTSTANRQSSELHVSADNGRVSHLLSGHTHHHYQSLEGRSEPFWGNEDSYPLATYGPLAPPDFGWRPPYRNLETMCVGQASSTPLASAARHASARQDTAEYIPRWPANQRSSPPSDTPPVRRSQNIIIPSFEHSGMAQLSAQHTYPSAYERNHVPAWKESQYSGEYRRQELNDRVVRADYIPVWRGSQDRGSQSSGSAHSLSSGGATGGSNGQSWEVMASCEFCGYQALLSTVQEHWLSCPHRTAVKPARQGVWIS
jgi:hypothetical protein